MSQYRVLTFGGFGKLISTNISGKISPQYSTIIQYYGDYVTMKISAYHMYAGDIFQIMPNINLWKSI